MKKLILSSIIALATTTCFASDYIQQEVTSEVYTETKVETYQTYQQPTVNPHQVRPLRPITVHTGRTVTVQDHYDVYQPRIVYDKVDSYTTTKTCRYCY